MAGRCSTATPRSLAEPSSPRDRRAGEIQGARDRGRETLLAGPGLNLGRTARSSRSGRGSWRPRSRRAQSNPDQGGMKLQTSTFRLTFRTMQGNAYLRSRSRRTGLSALSAVLVLAFAAFPVFAQADSAGAQYQDRLPTATQQEPHHAPTVAPTTRAREAATPPRAAAPAAAVDPPRHPDQALPRRVRPVPQQRRRQRRVERRSRRSDPGEGTDTVNASNAGYQSGNGDGGSSPLVGILVGLGLGPPSSRCSSSSCGRAASGATPRQFRRPTRAEPTDMSSSLRLQSRSGACAAILIAATGPVRLLEPTPPRPGCRRPSGAWCPRCSRAMVISPGSSAAGWTASG